MGRLHPAPQLPLIRSKGRKGQENVKVTNAAQYTVIVTINVSVGMYECVSVCQYGVQAGITLNVNLLKDKENIVYIRVSLKKKLLKAL